MSKKIIYKKNIRGLWNHYNYVKKYNNYKYTNKDGNLYHMTGRKNIVVKYLNKLNLGKNITILELGFGAGQNAKDFIKYCKKFYGIDISAHLTKFAKNNNKKSVKSGKAKFLTGSIEEKFKIKSNSVDVIIIVGALQYVMDLEYCFSQCRRVLRENGKMIIAQSNTFKINDMIRPRTFLVNFFRILLSEEFHYSHSTSLKSILLETKMKKYFKKYKKSWWMNSRILSSGYNDVWNFKGRRRVLSFGRLQKIINENKFEIVSSCGFPFFYNNKNILTEIIFKFLDTILVILNKFSFFSYILKYIGSNSIFLCNKK